MLKEYDILVIGGGPGGYVAAIRAAQVGFKVALVEEYKVGGVCLHKGCIPTKCIIKSAEVYNLTKNSHDFGIIYNELTFNFKQIKERTTRVVNTLHSGVKSLLSKNKVDIYNHRASLMGASIFSPLPGSVSIPNENGESDVLVAKNIIIATGTSVNSLPGLDIDNKFILSSDDILQLTEVPKSLTIIGGGVIGIEWASLLNLFGCDVTIIEYSDRILPFEDNDISQELAKNLIKKGIKIFVNATVLTDTLIKNNEGVSIKVDINGKKSSFKSAKMLVAVGRTPNTKNIGLENTRVSLDKKGYIEVDNNFRTKEKHIFAIGDVTGFMQLAHVASACGVYVAEYLKGLKPHPILKDNMPKCVYSKPEVASIGLTENEAKNRGIDIKVSKFPYMVNPKAILEGETEGFIKVIVNKKNNDLVGVHMIGNKATELISISSLAKFLNASGLELGKSIYPHPSISEVIPEAALDIYNRAVHKN